MPYEELHNELVKVNDLIPSKQGESTTAVEMEE